MNVPAQIAACQPLLRQLSRMRFRLTAVESDDLVQETMLKALLNSDKFTPDTNLHGWLFTIMRNTFINECRKKQRYSNLPSLAQDSYLSAMEDHHTFSSPEGSCGWRDMWDKIDSLREELKAPFKLHATGYKYHEIADALSIPIGTVKNRIFMARQEIRRVLAG